MIFSVNHCPGAGQGCGELETGPAGGCPGMWAGQGSRGGLSRDSQGWQCPHGPGRLLTLFQNNEEPIIQPRWSLLTLPAFLSSTEQFAISAASHTATADSETTLPETNVCALWFLLHPSRGTVHPTAFHEIVFPHHIFSPQRPPVCLPVLAPKPRLLTPKGELGAPRPLLVLSAAVWLAEKRCELEIACLA